MRKLLLSTVAAIILAGPALAETKSISANLGVIKTAPTGILGQSTIITALGVDFIAVDNRVDVLNPATGTLITVCTATVALGTIKDMVFTAPSFLTVQGGGPFAVTLNYNVCPPTQSPPVQL